MMIIVDTLALTLIIFGVYGTLMVISGCLKKKKQKLSKAEYEPVIQVLVPAYKADDKFEKVLFALKEAIAKYPIEVLVVLQECEQKILDWTKASGFEYVNKRFSHLGGNSYQHALKWIFKERLSEEAEYVMILDKDNVMDIHFFDSIYETDFSLYDVVQGVRKEQTLSAGIQVIDALSERYNDLMLREGKVVLGLPLEVSGSAALIRKELFKHAILNLDTRAPGFDKNLMVNMLARNGKLKTIFRADMVVYEEKTSTSDNYRSQRLRWFGEQYYNAVYHFKTLFMASLNHRSLAPADYWFSIVRPPRSIQLVVSFLLVAVDMLDLQPSLWSVPFLLNGLGFGLVARGILTFKNLKRFALSAPLVIWQNIFTSINALQKKYQGTFIHTRKA